MGFKWAKGGVGDWGKEEVMEWSKKRENNVVRNRVKSCWNARLRVPTPYEHASSRALTRFFFLSFCQVHPDNSCWTCFEQEASLDVISFFGFEATVEKLACKHYAANIKKGKEIILYYIEELLSQGVTILPKWEPVSQAMHPDALSPAAAAPAVTFTIAAETEAEEVRPRVDSMVSVSTLRTRRESAPHDAMGGATADLPDRRSKEVQKIDSDYIEKFLGPLSFLEESKLMEMRKWISETHKDKMPNEAHLMRFLRARDFNVEKAREMLHQSLLWRKQHQIDRLLTGYKSHPVITDYFAGSWHREDMAGRPLYVLRLGQMDFKGLLRAVGEDDILRHLLATCEEGLQKCEKATKTRQKPISSWTGLVDLEGLSMRHLWRPGVRVLLRMIELVEANYPETMGRLLIVRAPRVFPVLWTLVSPFIDENTRNKFLILGGNDYQGPGGLTDYIDTRYIPDFLDGDSQCDMAPGGLIPKSLYMAEVDQELTDGPPLETDSIYHPANIFRGTPHEVLIPVLEPGTVITWDFDVIKGDCIFALMKTKRPVDLDIIALHSHHHSQHGHNSPASPKLGTVMDRPLMALGVDAFNAESPLVVREGDSIQVRML
ncbi:PREDICTED: SEC14-like protein 1 [Priapulus caudatus]|uniref:SEC14-like protein 1 n=1 Tax=Priapulus caudatus TaxID=37621 RepID=A0ABM1ENL0_PRICU|nr:PREDICTED: SEC14-like protein 1 [Priapulus caudatus]